MDGWRSNVKTSQKNILTSMTIDEGVGDDWWTFFPTTTSMTMPKANLACERICVRMLTCVRVRARTLKFILLRRRP
uniref:Uncharacterized protein n=1 Tax=Syphacia muris TaxID=451379 RepID=A0A0N5ATP0_9BILA